MPNKFEIIGATLVIIACVISLLEAFYNYSKEKDMKCTNNDDELPSTSNESRAVNVDMAAVQERAVNLEVG